MRHRVSSSLVALAAIAAAGLAPAATRQVPADVATIAEAIYASARGDTILVAPGTYAGPVLLTDAAGDGVTLQSTAGPSETKIYYGETPDANEAVVTLQRCSDSTRVVGFAIDGRGIARHGVLVNSGGRSELVNLDVAGCEYGVACHKDAHPVLRRVATTGARAAGLYVTGASAEAQDCRFVDGDRFGVYVDGTSAPVLLHEVEASGNDEVGEQFMEGEMSVEGGLVSANGDVGILVQGSSPEISRTTIADQQNVGVVLERSGATLAGCTIRGNEYGVVVSIEGQPRILRCLFEDNRTYHLGVEGTANPLVGGSAADANRFLGNPTTRVQTSSSAQVNASYNFWGDACAPDEFFRVTGTGELLHTPWMNADLAQSFEDCAAARAAAPSDTLRTP
jgi:hypothetical protein